MSKQLISIVAPMFNEEETILEYCITTLNVLSGLSNNYKYELLLVNDGSRDRTLELMHQIRTANLDTVSIVNLSRNFGLEGAISAGLRKASGDAVIVMDADLQDPPSLIPILVSEWEKGAEIVSASRKKRANDGWFKRTSADIYYYCLKSLSGKISVDQKAANYRLLSRRAVDQVISLPEVNSVFRVVVPFVGLKTAIIEYERNKRVAGKTKYNIKSMIPYALDSITGLSVVPLHRLALFIPISVLFILGSIFGFIMSNGLWQIGFMICILLSILFSGLFLCVSVIAVYLAQIMTEVKGRPNSIVSEYMPCKNARGATK
jgi:polyisoprenyl-phosphate glycosyltransferase